MSHSFGPFQFYTVKILYPRCFSPVVCTPEKVIRHMTSDFDVRESDRIRYCLDASLLSRKMYKTALDSYGGGHLKNVTEDESVS